MVEFNADESEPNETKIKKIPQNAKELNFKSWRSGP